MNEKLPERKRNRLKDYNYSDFGMYFVTLCTDNRRNLFWRNVGENIVLPKEIQLSKYGKIVENGIMQISNYYPMVTVEKYVIMPNHIHMLIQINGFDDGRPMVAPTISTVIQQMKGYCTKNIGFSLWQKSFFDHIVRNKNDYLKIWEYIDTNPYKWKEDELYFVN